MQLLHRRHYPADHYVLVDDVGDVPAEELVAEARRRAESLAEASTGSRHCFTLIHNGTGIARRANPHVHIVCAGSRSQKALIYFLIGLKNLYADLRTWRA